MDSRNWAVAALAFILSSSSIVMAAPPPRHHRHSASDRTRRVQHGAASFYGHREAGRTTASGRPLSLHRMTAASPTLPLGTRAKVTNTDTGQSAQVTITDRGPYAKGRIIDVTPKAAEQIGITKDRGVAPVAVKPVSEPAPSPQ